jgi:adenine-specific DNA-methyltransferase
MQSLKLSQIRKALGAPYYEDFRVLLYHGDCADLMKRIPSELIDLTVTSPPYNIGKEYEEPIPIEDYVAWCAGWMGQIHRITAANGAFWLNVGYFEVPGKGLAVPIAYHLWDKSPFYFLQEVVWNYGAGVACRKRLSPRNEKLLWYVKNREEYSFNLDDIRDPNVKYPNQKKNGVLKCNPLGKNPTDVWQIAKVTSGQNRASPERTAHPAQFPIELVERIVLASSSRDQLVLDPFLGSGSTADTAIRTNRIAVGFEIDERYLSIAAERLSRTSYEIRMSASQSELALDV